MEVVAITHTLCVARYVCSRTTSCLPMLDCKAGHSLLLYQNKLEVQRDRNQRPVHYQCVDKPKSELGNGALPEVTNVWRIPRRLFRKAIQQGRSERRGESYSLPYVEPLSETRTPLVDFVNSLLSTPDYSVYGPSYEANRFHHGELGLTSSGSRCQVPVLSFTAVVSSSREREIEPAIQTRKTVPSRSTNQFATA